MKPTSRIDGRCCFSARVWWAKLLAVTLGAVAGTTSADCYKTIYTCNPGEGSGSGAMCLAGGTLYGTTYSGGSSGLGTVYRVNKDGSGFQLLRSFTGSDGSNPYRGLVVSGDTIYGSTYSGGRSNCGTVYRLSTDGSGFTVLKEFEANGKSPVVSVVAGTQLYGTTYDGGDYQSGTVWRMENDGGGFTVIKHFTGGEGPGIGDGAGPAGVMVLQGSTLFGTTVYGGGTGRGVIFRMNLDGTGYTVLKEGTDLEGGHYVGGLALGGNVLFGTTPYGGTPGGGIGVLYSMKTDGSDYRVLHRFTGFNGVNPSTPVVSGSLVFGTADHGGSTNCGTVFGLSTDGSRFAMLHDFTGLEAAHPSAVVEEGGRLYGSAAGSSSASGTRVFEIQVVPTLGRQPESQTAEAGSTVRLSARAESPEPMGYQWYFDAAEQTGGNTNTLVLSHVQPAQAGVYSVVVTNPLVAVTSSPAWLNVVPAVPREQVPAIIVRGNPGETVRLEAAEKLAPVPAWAPVATLSLAESCAYYFETDASQGLARFYRGRSSEVDSPSRLEAWLVPALTLAGNVGQQMRVEAINQVGPVTNWFELGVVTLTHSAQRYYDLTAPGQPPRVYRVTPVP